MASTQRLLTGFDDLDEPVPPPPRARRPPRDDAPRSTPVAPPAPVEALVPPSEPVVYVVDAHSLIYQVFHAMPEMTGPHGQPVGAIHGFLRDLADLLEKKKPDFLIVAFDTPGGTFRHEMFDQYKIHREEMPNDLRVQIPVIRSLLDALGLATLACPGFEADDVMATVARECEERGYRCFLVTGDKDCRQLLSPRVKMFNIRKNLVLDEHVLLEDWGVRPDQVVDFQALWGDSVDNVPGISGIGKKTARELLEKFDTLEGIYEHLDDIPQQKRRESLIAGREDVRLSRELIRLKSDVPVTVDWSQARPGRGDGPTAESLFRDLGFRRLGERLLPLTANTAPVPWHGEYRAVTDADELRRLAAEMAGVRRLSVDTETTSTLPRWAELVGLSFAWEPGRAYYVPIRTPTDEPRLDERLVLDILRPVLENPQIEKIGQNLKYDLIVLRGAGVELRGLACDTMVADYLLAPGERNHDLDYLSSRYLRHDTITIDRLIGTGRNQRRMDEVPLPQITEYAAEDADVPLRLAPILERRLAEEGLDELYRTLEMPLIDVLAEMEFQGIRVDTARLAELAGRFGERMAAIESEVWSLAGSQFNLASNAQLAKVLFEQLGLPVLKKTKTGPSTDAEVLEELAAQHPLPAKLMEHRQLAKLKGGYVDALPALVHPRTGRVHTSLKQDVTATGRLSSTDPNLQNIPIRTEVGREIRSAFLPEAGWTLMAADYSQIELRVLAHFTHDANLQMAFDRDQDIHAIVASEVFGVSLEEVTPEMRRRAKAVNFGVIYGQAAFGLARSLGIEKDEAARFIDAYFARFSGVDAFVNRTLAEGRTKGCVTTLLGRRRAVQGIRTEAQRGTSRSRNLAERIAINTVIQGSAADLIKLAMLAVSSRLRRDGLRSRLLLQIHDELLLEVPPEEAAAVARLLVDEMSAVARLSVPLKVDVKQGANWAECEAV